MAISAQSTALRSRPGMVARPSSTASFTPNYPSVPSLPQLAPLARDATLPNFLQRQLVANQLGQIGNQQNATFTGIQANAKQALAGYGGYSFRNDDPNTAQREDLLLNYDASKGMGEREKGAARGATNQANAAGMLESSFANQNIAAAVQRTSLEAQAIANQYARDINAAATEYANQGANLVGQYAGYYGADAQWALENPPPTPDPTANLPKAADGSPLIWRGAAYPNIETLQQRFPGYQIGVRKAGDGSYVAVIGQGSAKPPVKKVT